MSQDPVIRLNLLFSQINTIADALAEKPWQIANPIIHALETQTSVAIARLKEANQPPIEVPEDSVSPGIE